MKSANIKKLYEIYGGEKHIEVPDELKFAHVENEVFPERQSLV